MFNPSIPGDGCSVIGRSIDPAYAEKMIFARSGYEECCKSQVGWESREICPWTRAPM